jgi:hypothetical protein
MGEYWQASADRKDITDLSQAASLHSTAPAALAIELKTAFHRDPVQT